MPSEIVVIIFTQPTHPPTQSKILATPMLAAGGLVIIKGKIWGLIYKQILGKILKFSASFT